jgi:hypothetical protein
MTDGTDGLDLANSLVEEGLVEFAHPNFVDETSLRDIYPSNELFPDQWHLNNTGQNGGMQRILVSAHSRK